MIVTEVRAAHVPVEILGFQIKREYVRQNGIHGTGDVLGRSGFQVGGRSQWSAQSAHDIFSAAFHDVPFLEVRSESGQPTQGNKARLTVI
jgi:hypothetical protein